MDALGTPCSPRSPTSSTSGSTAGLRDWDVSRDAPYFGFEIPDAPGKYFYVWLDAPIGYMASFENLCDARGLDFDDYWKRGQRRRSCITSSARTSCISIRCSGRRRSRARASASPTAVYAHGFLTVNGEKMSKSRGTFITARHYLDRLPPEYFRYFLAAKLGPGLDDIDLNLEEFATRINADLVGKLVNIASRCASFIHRGHGGRLAAALPDPALYREFVDAGAQASLEAWESLEYAAARARDHGARRPRQPVHRPPQALARWRRTRRAPPRCRRSAPRASTCSAC